MPRVDEEMVIEDLGFTVVDNRRLPLTKNVAETEVSGTLEPAEIVNA